MHLMEENLKIYLMDYKNNSWVKFMIEKLCCELLELRRIILMADSFIVLDTKTEIGREYLKRASNKIDEMLQREIQTEQCTR